MQATVLYGSARDDLREEPAAQLAGKLHKRNCGQRMGQNKKSLSLAPVLLQEKRQIERAAETESVPAHARGIRQGHVGEALEQHGEQNVANGSPGQVRARAMMRAVAKGLVRIGLAQPVVVLAIFENVLVSVGR